VTAYPIKSAQLCYAQTASAGRTVIGTVPADTLWILKSFLLADMSGTQSGTFLYAGVTFSAGPSALLFLFQTSGFINGVTGTTWVVLNAGDELWIQSDGVTALTGGCSGVALATS
jgi:hypothetical protein